MKRILTLLAAGLWLAGSPPARAAADYDDFSELDLSALLDQVVVTAAKHAQKIGETPATVYVVTADQIAAAGAVHIAELLRDIPGLDVVLSSGSHQDVSARGLNEAASNAVLVLVDGRSVYADFYGVTIWETLPVSIDEIKVIEVILGPGSAYYGANAFACVINIITFGTDELTGTRVRGVAETSGTAKTTLMHTGGDAGLGWRVSSTQSRMVNLEEDRNEGNQFRGNGKLEWRAGEETRLTVDAGGSVGTVHFVPSSQAIDLDGTTAQLGGLLEWRDLKLRAFLNTWNLDVTPLGDVEYLDLTSELDADVVSLELNHVVRPGGGHSLQWGGEYRHKRVAWLFDDENYAQTILSAFLADEWRLSDGVLLSLGARYDDHPLVGGHLAPRGGLVVRPGDGQTLRASYGVAYRDPSYLESYWHTEVAAVPGFPQSVHGSLDLESEQIRSLELGYQGMLGGDALATVALFRNEVHNIIDMDIVENYASPPAPFPGIPSEIAFLNDDNWLMYGAEASLELKLGDAWGARLHWAHVHAEDADNGKRVEKAPRHIGGIGLRFAPAAGHELRLLGQYRSATSWRVGSVYGPSEPKDTDERVALDLVWHWNPRGVATHVTAGVLNLLGERFRDLPLAMEQERRARLSVRTEF